MQWSKKTPCFFIIRYLVDPASSDMLVSKIKPCMSKYNRKRDCERLIKSVKIYLMVKVYMDNRRNSRANTCAKPRLLGRGALVRFKTNEGEGNFLLSPRKGGEVVIHNN